MLKETIRAYEERRISEAEYLHRVKEIQESVLNRTGSDIPENLREREIAQAFYGISFELFKTKMKDESSSKEVAASAGLGIDNIIQSIILDNGKPKIDWQNKSDLIGQMEIAIGDFLIDEIRDKYQLSLSFGDIGDIAEKCIDIAKLRYK